MNQRYIWIQQYKKQKKMKKKAKREYRQILLITIYTNSFRNFDIITIEIQFSLIHW